MPRAMLLAICLTSRYRRPPGPSCAGSGSSSRFARKSLRSRCAACIFLMQLCATLVGCGAKPAPAPAPVIVAVQPCARPSKPSLPALRGVFLESRQGYTLLKARDARIRAYIAGLEDTVECYERQIPEKNSESRTD